MTDQTAAGSPALADPAIAATFIAALTGAADGWQAPVTFRTFTDDATGKAAAEAEARGRGEDWRDPLARNLYGTLQGLQAKLSDLNHQGAGIYIVVNSGAGEVRGDADVTGVRALFVDDDHGAIADAADLEPAPSIVVRTKQGLHAYWLVEPGMPVDGFRGAQERLIHRLRTDRSIKNPSRVMRLPGFLHMKDPAAPLLVTVEALSPGRRYDALEVLRFYPEVPRAQPVRRAALVAAEGRGDGAADFQKWCAAKGSEDGTRNANLWRILTEGRGRVEAADLTDGDVLSAMLDYRDRSGCGRTDAQIRAMWASPWRGPYNANLPTRRGRAKPEASRPGPAGKGEGAGPVAAELVDDQAPDIEAILSGLGDEIAPTELAAQLAPLWPALAALPGIAVEGWKKRIVDRMKLVSASAFNKALKPALLERQAAEAREKREARAARRDEAQGLAATADGGTLRTQRFQMTPQGVFRFRGDDDEEGELVCTRPIWLSGLGVDLTSGSTARRARVSFFTPTGDRVDLWRPFGICSSPRALAELTEQGAPVDGSNLNIVGAWLNEMASKVVGGDAAFLISDRPGWRRLPDEGDALLVAGDARAQFAEEQPAPIGSPEGWAEGLRLYQGMGEAGFPALAVAGLAAGSPLMRWVKGRMPVAGLVSGSGLGKTITLKYMLSMWGDPDKQFIDANHSTAKGVQDRALELQDLPLLVDEFQELFKSEKDAAAAAALVYFFGSGKARTVAKRDGSGSRGGEMRYGVAFYAAERAITPHLTGGANNRVVEIRLAQGAGFVADGPMAKRIEAITTANTGALAQTLAAKMEQERTDLVARVRAARDLYAEAFPHLQGDDHVTIALVDVGLGILEAATGLQLAGDEVATWLAKRVASSRKDVDDASTRAVLALWATVTHGGWVLEDFVPGLGKVTRPTDVLMKNGTALAWAETIGTEMEPGPGWLEVNPHHPEVERALRQYGGLDRHLAIWADRGYSQRGGRHLKYQSRKGHDLTGQHRHLRFPTGTWNGPLGGGYSGYTVAAHKPSDYEPVATVASVATYDASLTHGDFFPELS